MSRNLRHSRDRCRSSGGRPAAPHDRGGHRGRRGAPGRRGHADAAGQGGIDRLDGGGQAAVLGPWVKLVQVLGLVGGPAARATGRRPRRHGGPAGFGGRWPSRLGTAPGRPSRLEVGARAWRRAASRRSGMDGPHEAKVGRAVIVVGLRSPPAPPNGQDRRTGRDSQEQHPGAVSVLSLGMGAPFSWISGPRSTATAGRRSRRRTVPRRRRARNCINR